MIAVIFKQRIIIIHPFSLYGEAYCYASMLYAFTCTNSA